MRKHCGKFYYVLPLPSQSFYRRTAGIRKSEHSCDLIERFAGGIVQRTAENTHFIIIFYCDKRGVSAACENIHKRRFERFIGKVCRGDVSPYMAYGNKRNTERKSQRLGKRHPDEQRAEKSRAVRYGNGIYIGKRFTRLCKRVFRCRENSGGMRPRRDFRYHTAENGVRSGGTYYLVRKHLSAAIYERNRRFVARSFYTENQRFIFDFKSFYLFGICHCDFLR